jgi:hypothetical protein
VNKKVRWIKKTETGKEAQREKSLPKEYTWEGQGAKREKKKERSTGGIITGVKLGVKEKRQEKGEKGRMERKVHRGNKWWKIMTIYSKEVKTTRGRIENGMKENKEECMLMGGDFNGRIGERGARNWEEKRGDGKRKSKNNVENAEGKRLMEPIEENGWEVLNGDKQGDEEGETVIDYEIANEEAWERVQEVRIGERAESDDLEIALRKRRGGKENRREIALRKRRGGKENVTRNRKARRAK